MKPIYVGIVSDSHGKFTPLEKMIHQAPDAAAWIHCGDYCEDGEDLAAYSGVPVYTVKGNNDFMSLSKAPECRKISIGGITILAVHGHQWYGRSRLENLLSLGRKHNSPLVVFGHTHRRFCETFGNIIIANPGSISLPRDGKKGTYAICRIEDNALTDVKLCELA